MGVRGPAPKREEHRIRRNKPERETIKLDAAVHTDAPFEADPKWHAIAVEFWTAHENSGQSQFYAESDWAALYILCETLSRELKPQFIGFAEGYDDEGREVKKPVSGLLPIKGATLSALKGYMASLLTMEGDRRRLQIELQKPQGGVDPDEEIRDNVRQLHIGAFQA